MTTIINTIGTDRAECQALGLSVKSRTAPICALAREMIAHGVGRDERVTVMRGDIVSMRGTVGWFADRTVSEGEASCRFAKWVPFDARVVTDRSLASDANVIAEGDE